MLIYFDCGHFMGEDAESFKNKWPSEEGWSFISGSIVYAPAHLCYCKLTSFSC